MKRILVFGISETPGGVENFLLNYYRHVDRDRLQFDFLFGFPDKAAYEDELIHLGARTFHITARRKGFLRYRKELNKVFREHVSEWSAIWLNVSSVINIDYLKIAKKNGIRKRVIHSHSGRYVQGVSRRLFHEWNRVHLGKYATDYWACSVEAARYLYKKELLSDAQVIHNAIDVDGLAFSMQKREQLRKTLGINENTFVIGNIGRLHFEKNQGFVIEVFKEYSKLDPDSYLILVGDGVDREKLRRKASDIEGKVLFAGFQEDIQEWLSAFDFFLFPSLYEGFGMSALEAQANGLPVLASGQVIPEELKIANDFEFLGLSCEAKRWAQKIWDYRGNHMCEDSKLRESLETRNSIRMKDAIKNLFRERGFDITVEAGILEEFFMQ